MMNREQQWVKISLIALVCIALILIVYVFMELNKQSSDDDIFVTSIASKENTKKNNDKSSETIETQEETKETLKDDYDLVSGIYARRDGTVVSIFLEEFDKSYYSLKELKESYIEPDIEQYNQEKSADEANPAIKILDLKMMEKNVVLVLDYQTCNDYLDYNSYIGGKVLYNQTIGEALADNQVIEGTFLDADGNGTTSAQVRSHEDYSAVAIDFKSIVQVQGEIMYVSSNVEINNEHTATTNGELSYIIYKERDS